MSETIEILSAVHGIAPKSDELLQFGTDLERGRISQATYNERIDQETIDWLELQEQAGIDICEDGKLDWPDHLRNIVKGSDGFAPDIDNSPVTRWFEDNRFYRQPTITGRLRFDKDKFESTTPDIDSPGSNISLIAPSSFASLCKNEYMDLPADRNVLQLYSELLFYLDQVGVSRVTFEDYSDGNLSSNGINHSLSDVETLTKWCRDINFAIINPQNKETAIPWRLSNNLGVQIPLNNLLAISREPDFCRPNFRNGEIWHNVIDASTTSDDNIGVECVPIDIIKELEPARIVLTHTVDLECLPLVIAQEKVKSLGKFAIDLREELAK